MRFPSHAMKLFVIGIAGLTASASPVWSAQAVLTGTVERVLTTDGRNFGGCMAFLSANPQNALPRCAWGWVSFSCSGDYTQPAFGFRMLDQAQLALAGGKFVQVHIDDTRLHDGYCFAYRIDVIR